MANVVFHPAASAEYRAALAWYAARSRWAALGFEREVERILATLAVSPLRYPEYDVTCREAILTRYPYSVIYRIESDGSVLVVAVAHASREPGYWLGRISP
jgi:plasmid stabilization system protein ParE